MSEPKSRTGTVIAAVFAVFIVAAGGAAASRFVGKGGRPKAYECKVVLRDILWAQRGYLEQHQRWATTFQELGFKPEKNTRYTYFIGPDERLLPDPAKVPHPTRLELPRLSRELGVSSEGFAAACAADLDGDPTLDIWTISSVDGEPFHELDDG